MRQLTKNTQTHTMSIYQEDTSLQLDIINLIELVTVCHCTVPYD